jgi:hypothetical protein
VKFIIQWHTRASGSAEEFVSSGESVLAAFGGWTPPESFNITEFVARVDGRGGTLVVETDDLPAVDLLVAQYSAWFDYDVTPVLDIAEGAAQFGEGIAWAKQALG